MGLIKVLSKQVWIDSKPKTDEQFNMERKTKSRSNAISIFGLEVFSKKVEYEYTQK